MQPTQRRTCTPWLLIAIALSALAGPARASDPEVHAAARDERVREIVRLVTRTDAETEIALGAVHPAFDFDRRGFHLRHDLSLGDRDIQLRFGGPIYKSSKRSRFGVAVELRF
jgi:hypothetical protein